MTDKHSATQDVSRVLSRMFENLGSNSEVRLDFPGEDEGSAHESLYWSEYHWRKEADELHKWIDKEIDPDTSGPSIWNTVYECVSRWESMPLKKLFDAEPMSKPRLEKIEKLREALEKVRSAGQGEGDEAKDLDDESTKDRVAAVRKALEQLNEEVDYKFHEKWPILTAFLALANPSRHVFIRPSVVRNATLAGSGCLFEGIKYAPGAEPSKYMEYLRRAREFEKALKDRVGSSGFEIPPRELSHVSIWWTAYAYRMRQKAMPEAYLSLIQSGRHLILQGPPGTGKTFMAERLAQELVKKGGEVLELSQFREMRERAGSCEAVYQLVQFHASYDYEDFVRGFRPITLESGGAVGFELRDGPFAEMVSYAMLHSDIEFILIIDEINRADLARVLGECIYLLDRRCYHGKSPTLDEVWNGVRPGAVTLRYQPDEASKSVDYKNYKGASAPLSKLCLPNNFHLVGTMNTADRSITQVDVALRRRFAFVDVTPDLGLLSGQPWVKNANEHWKQVKDWMERLNGSQDSEYDEQSLLITDARYRLGHAYFMKSSLEEVKQSVLYQVVPLLEEYRRDQVLAGEPGEVEQLLKEMRKFGGVS